MKRELINLLIHEVTPDINKSGNPEAELIKHAKANNLPPAALEHLAQLWNTGLNLHVMNKHANRGDEVDIVDVPTLVKEYQTFKPAGNAPAFPGRKRQETHRFPGIDALLNMESGDAVEVKVASNQADTWTPADALRLKTELRTIAEEAQAEKYAAIYDRDELLAKVVRLAARDPEADLKRAFSDTRLKLGETAVAPLTVFMNRLKSAGYTDMHELPEAGPRRLVYDSEWTNACQKWTEHTLRKMAASDIETYAVNGEVDKLANWIGGKPPTTANLSISGDPKKPEGDTDSEKEDPAQFDPNSVQGYWVSQQVTDKGKGSDPGDYFAAADERRLAKSEAVGKFKEDLSTSFGILTGQNVGGGQSLNELIGKMVGGNDYNAGQDTIDRTLENTRRTANLQTLLVNDEVLADADPDLLERHFETILNNAPRLADDPNTLSVTLRGMLERDGIDAMSLKALSETDTVLRERERSEQRYRDDQYRIT